MVKIAFVVGGNYSTSIYIVTKDVVGELRNQGHQVDYVFLEKNTDQLKGSDKFIDIKYMNRDSFKGITGSIFRAIKNILSKHVYFYVFSGYFSMQLERELSSYDGVFVQGLPYIQFHKLKCPHFCVLHSCKYDNLLGRRKGIVKFLYLKLYQRIYSGKRLLTVSDSVKQDMLEKIKAKPLSIETIYNGFNFEDLEKKAVKTIDVLHGKSFILAVGRPDHTKRFDVLLKAYAKTQRSHDLLIFGNGRKLKNLQKLACKLGVEKQVFFKGFNPDILPYFKQASAYILSSDIEGLPTVVIESLALGTPVVATDAGGVRELLNGELSQWIVPRGDIETLAEKIDQILKFPPLVRRENIDFLDYRDISKKYLKHIKEITNELQ